jgi:hypothetical protein
MWANGLNPNDPTAFITALMFESSGSFIGTMTAITTNVSEPSSLPLLGSAFLGWGAWLRRRAIRGQDTELRQRPEGPHMCAIPSLTERCWPRRAKASANRVNP